MINEAPLIAAVMAALATAGPGTDARAGTESPFQPCHEALAADGVAFADLGTLVVDGCIVEGAVELRAVASPFGTVMLSGAPRLTCPFARQFTDWIRAVAAPLAGAYMGAALKAIVTGPGIVCRSRNGDAASKPSEHARGNALDITAFILENGERLHVGASSASDGRPAMLMRAYRAAACGYFTTILGPGSNASHADHLHFDRGLHGRSANYRICE